MTRTLTAVLVAGVVAVLAAPQVHAQFQKPTTIELTGCVSLRPDASGEFAFVDAASGGTYRLKGKGLKRYAGQRVTVVGDPTVKRVRIRLGLWPSPNVAAQAGAMDPAQESIARQPGGAASASEPRTPELRVVRMHGVAGACE
jgi:hypothetical protein